MDTTTLIKIFAAMIPVLFAITLHEVAHGWVANKFGDPTAKMLGRLTLNPIKHIDPIGTLLVPFVLMYLSGFIFGWAKPVPVTWSNLRNPRRDMALVALAGPFSNFIMAIVWAIVFSFVKATGSAQSMVTLVMYYACYYGIMINIVLMVLNLIPIPPLDGSRVVSAILPPRLSYKYNLLEPFGFPILLILLFTGLLKVIMLPMIELVFTFIKVNFIT